MAERTKVFIAYCFPEKRWLDRVLAALEPIAGEGRCVIWDERKLRSGVAWKTELPDVLATTKVAMMIVSDLFLESEFLTRAKLPSLIERERADGLEICWVLASHCLFELAGLKESDLGNRVGAAFDGLGTSQRDAEAVVIAAKVAAYLGVEPPPKLAQPVEKPLLPSAIPAVVTPKPVLKKRKNLGPKKQEPAGALPLAPAAAEAVAPVVSEVPAAPAAVALPPPPPPEPAPAPIPRPEPSPPPAVAPVATAPAVAEPPVPASPLLLSLETMILARQATVLKLSSLARGILYFASIVALASIAAAIVHSFTHFLLVAGFAAFVASLALRLHARSRFLGQGLVALRYTSSGLADDALPTRQRESLLRKADEYLAQN